MVYRRFSPLEVHNPPALTQDITIDPYYMELRAVLGNLFSMRDGGVRGLLVIISMHTLISTLLHILLKGSDRVVFFAATCLGLSVIVKPVVKEGKGMCNCFQSSLLSGYETIGMKK